MTSSGFVSEGSPDKVDGLVWALTELFLGEDFSGFIGHYRAEAEKAEEARKKTVAAPMWLPPK